VTSVSAASAAIATPLVTGDEVLSVLPGTLPVRELARRLADADAAVVMKLGRSYPQVREALRCPEGSADASTCGGASTDGSGVCPACRGGRDGVLTSRWRYARRYSPEARAGTVAVVGLGPGDVDWMKRKSRRELADATT